MPLRRIWKRSRELWDSQGSIERAVVVSSIALVLFAYLPTLQFDYATQDQWRAFRYPEAADSAFERLTYCSQLIPSFYARTGRPLVWLSECVEHAAVWTISDFAILRPISLGVVLLTVLYLSSVLARSLGSFSTAIVAASACVLAPGYSFMYLQGLPALMVLVSLIFAAASYDTLRSARPWLLKERSKMAWALSCFLTSCLIYPAYAFAVLPLALLDFSLKQGASLSERTSHLGFSLTFYGAGAATYYIFVKSYTWMLWSTAPSLGTYDVALQMTPSVIFERASTVAQYFLSMPPFNFEAPIGLTMAILAAFATTAAARRQNTPTGTSLTRTSDAALLFAAGCAVLLGSASPWIFSSMDNLATRHVLPLYLFISAASAWLATSLWQALVPSSRRWAPVLALTLVGLPSAVAQNRLSFLEIAATNAEIEALRAQIFPWLESEGWRDDRYLLVVRPRLSRPTGIAGILGDTPYGNDGAVLASSRNPVSIPWMLEAIVRERIRNPEFTFVDCATDTACAGAAAQDPKNVATGYTYGDRPIESPIAPYLINLSSLTAEAAYPDISIVDLPSVSASSQLDGLGPYGLLSAVQPGWHAERSPTYPQKVTVDLREERTFRWIDLLPQDGHSDRMPRGIGVRVGPDGKSWTGAGSSENLCETERRDGWHRAQLEAPARARYIQIEIASNCGNPEYLTLRGIRIGE